MEEIRERERYIILRKRNGIKLSEVAKFMGVSISAVSLYERYLMDFKGNKEDLYMQFITNNKTQILK